MREPDDAELINQVIEGNNHAFRGIMETYGPFVLSIVKRHVPLGDSEDIVQDVFLRIYRSLPGFSQTHSFRSWVSAIAVRTCYDFWRDQYRSTVFKAESLDDKGRKWLNETLSDDSHDRKGAQREAREVLDWALSRLGPGDRMVIELVYLEENSLQEAADLLGWSIANVKVRLFRSRRKLHKILESVREV